jgi:hypothetical protein
MSEGKTPRTLDQVLASWPEPERATSARGGKDIEWTPETAPSSRFADVSDDELLGPPLRAGAGEGTAPTSSRGKDRAKQQQQLQELAKLAERAPEPEPAKEKEESSGVVHLAALAASEGQNVDGTPLAASAEPAAPAEGRAAKPPSRKEQGVGRPSWLVVMGLVAAAAVVALVFGMKHPGNEAPVQVTVVAPAVPAPPVATTATAMPTATTNKDPLDKAVDPSTLPQADTAAAVGAHPSSPAALAAAPTKPAPAGAAAATAAVDPEVAKAAPAAPTSSASLESLMQQAAGTSSTAATATATESPAAAPRSVALKPSQGAIQGALGAALPGARACLGPDDPISRATVTFQSDGTVQSVTVTGGAAGKPAEACIRSALMRAKVPPFAVPTFTAPTTIRPD